MAVEVTAAIANIGGGHMFKYVIDGGRANVALIISDDDNIGLDSNPSDVAGLAADLKTAIAALSYVTSVSLYQDELTETEVT